MGDGGGVVQWLDLELSGQPGALGSVVSSLCGVWVKPTVLLFFCGTIIYILGHKNVGNRQFWSSECELLGSSWLYEPRAKILGDLEPFGPHKVAACGFIPFRI